MSFNIKIEEVTVEREEIIEKLKECTTQIKRELKKLRKKLQKQEVELEEAGSWEKLSHHADTLLANRDAVKKGMKAIVLPDVHTNIEIEIPLNPKCTVDKNADLFYKKARRGKRGYDTCEEKVAETESAIDSTQALLDEVVELRDDSLVGRESEALELIEKVANNDFSSQKNQTASGKQFVKTHPFRHYTIDGYDIYAGKTSRDNDELSTRFAKPSDVWFHAVGFAGSHVIIKRGKNDPLPPQKILDIAGGIAVFFSKAKNTSYAEVHMTEARFVRKPRKSPAGLVTADRCKTVRMSPVDPQKLFQKSL